MDVKDEADRVLEQIRLLLRRLDVSQRQVEQQAGFSRGYLSQLFARNMQLKYWQVIAILRVLDYSPRRFFAELYPEPYDSALEIFRRRSPPLTEELADSLEKLYPEGLPSVYELQLRVERCETAISELQRRGRRRPAS